ncbi:MAG: AAA family ATPase [Lachnospiraceae bacterium]|nr:AAA family ATPase [Lachnospiraceae bacterium]
MIIRELKIIGFGRHKDKKIELSDGINIIYGDNEAGKSTIAYFIYSMMYGIEKKRGKPAADSMYSKYQPIEGQWSGSMRFSYDNREYEVFRSFPVQEDPVVVDVVTGLQVDSEILFEAFGEERVFASSYYLVQDKNDDTGRIFGDVSEYAKRISTGKNERVDVAGAKKKIKNQIKMLEIRKNEVNLSLKESIKKSENLKECMQQYDREADNLLKLKEKRGVTNEKNEEKVESIKEYIDRFGEIELKYERYCQGTKQARLLIEMEEVKSQNKSRINVRAKAAYYSILAAIFVFALVITLLVPLKPVVKVLIMALLVLAQGVVTFLWDNVIIRKLAGLFIENEANAAAEESENCRKIIEELKDLKEEIEEYGKGGVSSFSVDDEGMEELQRCVTRLGEQVEKYYQMETEKKEELAREIERGEWMLDSISQKMNGDNYESVSRECEKLREELSQIEKKVKAVHMAEEIIDEISQKFSGDFKAEIIDEFSKNVAAFTCGRYERVIFDAKMNIKVLGKEGFVDIAKLSYGAVKQVYLALRMAVGTWLLQERIPLIVDDGFVYFDEKRLRETLKGLRDRHKGQIILFTCQKREKRVLEELEIPFEYIEI